MDREFDARAYDQGVRDGRQEAAAEIERLRADVELWINEIRVWSNKLNARCPVDAMDRGMSQVEAAVHHVWGERCTDFEPECLTCKAWAEYDENAKLRAALTEIRDAGPMTLDDQRWRIALAALGGEND